MKRKLLLLSILFGLYIPANAQVLQSDNFNALTVGNIGTDFTGATAGQGGWFTGANNGTAPTTSTNAGNANFQIVAAGGTHANVFSMQGPNGDKGVRQVWKNGLPAAWGTRTSGNNIIEIEFDVNTGATTTSKNNVQIFLFNADGSKILAGLIIAMETKAVQGAFYATSGGVTQNYLYNFATPAPVLTPNTWVRMGMSFNKTTGEVKWKGPGFNASYVGAAAGVDPDEVDYIMTSATGNTVAATVTMDNFVTRASATDTLLGTEAFTSVESSKLSVYPNPVNNVVTISNAENLQINKVVITDINGRTVKTLGFNGVTETQINVSDLNSGIYFMSIDTNEGTATKKIIKN